MSNAQGTTGKLAGKTYIVTGAAQGIGRAEAEHLALLSTAAQAIDNRAIFVRQRRFLEGRLGRRPHSNMKG